MATEVISSIGTGKNYTTLQAWWTAKKGNLVTADTIQIAEVYGTVTGYLFMPSADATTDSTHYYVIRSASGQEFTGDFSNLTGKARVYYAFSASYPYVVSCAVQYTVFQGLVVEGATTEYNIATLYGFKIGSQYITISNCGVRNIRCYNSASVSAFGIAGNPYAPSIINCFIDNISARTTQSSKNSNAYGIILGSGGKAYNCTVTNINGSAGALTSTTYGISGSSVSGMIAVNCLVGNVVGIGVGACFASGMSSNSKNNASTDATASTYSNGVDNVTLTNEITSTASGSANCKLKSGATSIDKAFNFSSLYTTDITGFTRVGTWDIGAYEFRVLGFKRNGLIMSKWNGVAVSKINGVA